ncbi:hypothetical protein DCO56_03650 [Sphingobacterium athyrii]|uniref:Uncharacterized protein n=1 Tax=Sphingobacterium athyrii TaxID=2152717 RepID=A0A363NZE5_9SPHI|nr:hypothetical protein DCO56_03650 [Sphingobacterium athyrii]
MDNIVYYYSFKYNDFNRIESSMSTEKDDRVDRKTRSRQAREVVLTINMEREELFELFKKDKILF